MEEDINDTWYKNIDKNAEVINVPEGVTTIPFQGFKKFNLLKKVHMPDGILNIGYADFYGCESLKEINIPDSVTRIGGEAFSKCTSLEKVNLPFGLISVENAVFSECASLKKMDIPYGVTNIDVHAFYRCKSLKEINIPDSVVSIGNGVFDGCESLKEIDIPDSATSIGEEAFYECTSLEKVILSNNLSKLSCHIFYGCSKLKEIIIPDSITSICKEAFSKCTLLEKVIFSNDLNSIGHFAFAKCSLLKEIIIPNSVVSIGDGAFSECNSLKGIVLPDSILKIGDNVFGRCTSLEKIILSAKLSNIGQKAFYNCDLLKEIVLPDTITKIPFSTFSGCKSLNKITFSSGITSIADSAFLGCEALKDINIKYKNKAELINSINILSNKIDNDLKKNISFIGPTLSVIDKLKISSIVKKQIGSDTTISFYDIENEKTSEEEIELVDVSNDIAEVVEKINRIKEIVIKLPIDVRNFFIEKTNELLSIYEINRKKEENSLKPVFGKNNTMPNLTLESNVNAKMALVLGLDLLLYKLSNSELYLNLITELNGYQELACQVPNEYDQENNGIEGMVKNISYIANKMDESNKNYILKKLNELLNEPRIKYERIVNSRINDKIELTTDSSLSPKYELIQKLSSYLDEVKSLYNLSKPYTEMLDGLKKDNAENKININSISSTIETTKYVLSTLDRTDEVIELENEIDKINKEYEELIISRLKSKKVSAGDYKELEKEYRAKLQPLLERLNSVAIKDAHFKDLRQKLTTSREIISEEKIINYDSKNVIESFTIEIHNKIINSNLTLSDKESLLEKIKSFINFKLESLDTLDDKDKDKIEQKINTEFAGLLLDVNDYIAKFNEHQSKIKENSAIDEVLKDNIKSI